MAGRGWRGLGDQTEAFALVWNDYWSTGRDDAAAIERQAAVADAECVLETGYAEVLAAAETRLVDHLTSDPDVIAYGALIEDALPRARTVVQNEAERIESERELTDDERQGIDESEAERERLALEAERERVALEEQTAAADESDGSTSSPSP